jgi:hypothetical protein
MSGTGKSSALVELERRGHRVVDTDYGGWTEGDAEPLWREDRIARLLDEHTDGMLFISGCVVNQGTFYPRFDAVVLLSAPADVILERVAVRETNDFGKTDSEPDRILSDLAAVEPLLRRGATAEIDTRAPSTGSSTIMSGSARRQLRNKTLTSPPPTPLARAPSLGEREKRTHSRVGRRCHPVLQRRCDARGRGRFGAEPGPPCRDHRRRRRLDR